MRTTRLLVGACLIGLFSGCGGGVKAPGTGGSAGTGGGSTRAGIGTARFEVNVKTGQVKVQALNGSRAVFGGAAVQFASSVLYDEAGNTGLKVLDVGLSNHSGLTLGRLADGTVTGVRVLFGPMTNLSAANLDLRGQVTVSTVAGSGVAGWQDGAALTGKLSLPWGVSCGTDGSLLLAELTNQRIRQLRGGTLSTVAGTGASGSADGPGSVATFYNPHGIAFNPLDGCLVVVDTANQSLRRVTPSGRVTRIAGNGTAGFADGTGEVARFTTPLNVVVNSSGEILLTDHGNQRVRKVRLTGADPTLPASYTVSTLAGSGSAASVDGVGTSASFNGPYGLALDGAGNLYVGDKLGYMVRRVSPDGTVTTIAGTGAAGTTDGVGNVAKLGAPYNLGWSRDGLVVSEYSANTLRLISPRSGASANQATGWVVRTLAGSGTAGAANGSGTTATFRNPAGVVEDAAGNLYVADGGNNLVRRVVATAGHLSLGEASGGSSSDVLRLSNSDGTVPSTSYGLDTPFVTYAVAVADGATASARKWAFNVPSGVTSFEFTVTVEAATEVPTPPQAGTASLGSGATVVRTLAGPSGRSFGFQDGTGAAALFDNANGVAADAAGNVYVADTFNSVIRKVTPAGVVTTLAGLAGQAGLTDGNSATARFSRPCGVAVNAAGTVVYVADTDNHAVRAVTLSGGAWQTTTVAGNGSMGLADGSGADARFSSPYGIAVDTGGNLFVSERGSHRVRRLYLAGGTWQVQLLAGSAAGVPGNVNGQGPAATFYEPRHLAIGPGGVLYVADGRYGIVRKIDAARNVTHLASGFTGLWGVAADSAGAVYATLGTGAVYRITPSAAVVAGSTSATGFVDGQGDQARFDSPRGLACTATGDLVLSDLHAIRTVQRAIGGGAYGAYTVADAGAYRVVRTLGPASLPELRMNQPGGLAADRAGHIFVADTYDHRVVKFDESGALLSTWGSFGMGDGQLYEPEAVALDSDGNTYVTTLGGIEKFDGNGTFLTRFDSGNTYDWTRPGSVAVDSRGNVYVTDTNGAYLVKFDSSGNFLTEWYTPGSGDGEFHGTHGVALDAADNLYVVDEGNSRIQKFDSTGAFVTKWGSAGTGNGQFDHPYGVAVAPSGHVYVVDGRNHRIQKFDSSGNFVAAWGSQGAADGQFSFPGGVAVDSGGNVYVADASNNRIQKFDSSGNFLAKWGAAGALLYPGALAADGAGNVYVADWGAARVVKYNRSGACVTQWGSSGSGVGQFNGISGVALNPAGTTVYCTSGNDNRVQRFDANGTYLSGWGSSGTGDGQFNGAMGIAVDAAGSVYVTDAGNHRIQKFTGTGTFLAKWGSSGTGDGQFSSPYGVAADPAGNIYVVEEGNSRVQKFSSTGAFLAKWGSYGNSTGQFQNPRIITVDATGCVYVGDSTYRVQRFASGGTYLGTVGQPYDPNGLAVDADGSVYISEWSKQRVRVWRR